MDSGAKKAELTDMDDDAAGVVPCPPAPTDWRKGRCTLTQTLDCPASNDDLLALDIDLLPTNERCDNIQDPLGYYDVLKSDKTTSNKLIPERFNEIRSKCCVAKKGHPDKRPNKKSCLIQPVGLYLREGQASI